MNKMTISFLLLALTACNPNYHNHPPNLVEPQTQTTETLTLNQAQTPVISVTNLKGESLAGAQVLIGSRVGQPFTNNLLVTDTAGQVITPADWNSPATVTVNHPGYMRVTYVNVTPHSISFKLRPLEKNERIELSGTTTGFGSLERNNVADFGLVLPSLTKRDLFAFSLNKIISPEMDSIDIAGFEARVPSNLTFPRQRESYILPITLEKERYRVYFNEPGSKKIYALHGKFPFKEVVDQIRNKVPFQALINNFQFVSGSMRDIEISSPMSVNLPVNEITFTARGTIIPPPLNSDKVMLSISLFEKNGYLYPTDMHKAEKSQAFTLKGLAKSNLYFLSMLTPASNTYTRGTRQEAVTIELVAQEPDHMPSFIDLITSPEATASGWTAKPPASDNSILPMATYSVLSKVYSNGKQKTVVREWEVYSENWVNSVELPEWPALNTEAVADTEMHRWELTYIGTNQKLPIPANAQLGPDVVDYTSHISFNSVEF